MAECWGWPTASLPGQQREHLLKPGAGFGGAFCFLPPCMAGVMPETLLGMVGTTSVGFLVAAGQLQPARPGSKFGVRGMFWGVSAWGCGSLPLKQAVQYRSCDTRISRALFLFALSSLHEGRNCSPGRGGGEMAAPGSRHQGGGRGPPQPPLPGGRPAPSRPGQPWREGR